MDRWLLCVHDHLVHLADFSAINGFKKYYDMVLISKRLYHCANLQEIQLLKMTGNVY